MKHRNYIFVLLAACMFLASCGGVPRLNTFEQGVEFLDYSDYPRAIEKFKKHIRTHGEDVSVCYNLGVCYQDQNNLDESVIWYEKALEYDPNDGDTLVNLGLVYLKQGRDAAALARFKRASEVEKDRGYPLTAIGIYYARVGKLDLSREYFDRSLRRENNSGYTWFHYAALHEKDQRFGDAAQAYERSTDFDSTYAAAYEGAGRCYMKLRNWRKAVMNFEFAVHLVPEKPELYIGAADALFELGRYERAVKYLWAARGLTSADDPEVRVRLLKIYPKLI
ncbi:MAG: tetratricopeptide repeat protein, partial [Planctomycetota bacterium]